MSSHGRGEERWGEGRRERKRERERRLTGSFVSLLIRALIPFTGASL